MSNTIVINQVVILFFIMIIGFLARKKGIVTSNITKGLTDILINITSPLLIFTSFQFEFSGQMLTSIGKILAFTFFIHLFSLLAGMVLFNRYPKPIKKVLRYATTFSNCGFMGFPILYGIYGKIGVLYSSFFLVGFNVFAWTAGIMIFTGHREQGGLKKVLLNPNIIAIILGMITFVLSIKITGPLFSALEMVGEMNTPVSMMVVGSILSEVKPKEIFAGFAVYYGSLIRLLAIPFVSLFVTNLLNYAPTLQGVCVLAAATPAATLTVIFAEKYNGDARFASKIVVISTVLSLFTLPLFIFLLNN